MPLALLVIFRQFVNPAMIAQVPTGIACQQNPEAPADVLFFFFLFFSRMQMAAMI